MVNTVYTRERIKAIVEETRLNANPSGNRQIYELLQDAKRVLRHPVSEAPDPMILCELKEGLAACNYSAAAKFYHRELSAYQAVREAHDILNGKTTFDLDEVAYSLRELGKYCPQDELAGEYRRRLDDLWVLVQKGKLHTLGIRAMETPAMKEVVTVFESYRPRSAEISGLHTALAEDLRNAEVNERLFLH